MNKAFENLGKFILIIMVASCVGLILAWPIMWTWNATVPLIFGLIKITWAQAWCLNFLAGCLIQSSYNHNSNS